MLGSAWGLFCALARALPFGSTLAQMAVPWIWVAALAGLLWGADDVRRSGLVGAATLLAANLSYFAVGVIARVFSETSTVSGVRFLLLWTVIGLMMGPASAIVGRWLRNPVREVMAVTLLATVSVAEPVALWSHINHIDAQVTYVLVAVVGLILPFVWLRPLPRRAVKATALTVTLLYPSAVVLELVLIVLGQVSAPARLI